MHKQYPNVARAVLSALAVWSTAAGAQEKVLADVVVTATPFNTTESAQILTPAKVLTGDELRQKLDTTLGETLSRELGVSATAFGAGASRPVIRGLEGPRVKILQNGMGVADMSALSADHAVATNQFTARQIEILRGPAALLYGSGAIGGLVNVVNDRIPTVLPPSPTGEAEVRFGTVDDLKGISLSADGAVGRVGLHLDASAINSDDYEIPGTAVLGDPDSPTGTLPNSFARDRGLGLGASYIANWGHVGASVGILDQRYGIPTEEQAFIDLSQTRFDVAGQVNKPFVLADSLSFKLAATEYEHTENSQDGTPLTDFQNDAVEARVSVNHAPLAGWRGSIGLQAERSEFSALSVETGRPDAVPTTESTSVAAFLVEERDFGPVRASAGARVESVRRRPEGAEDPAVVDRRFNLASFSAGALWSFLPGYGFGGSLSLAQRAPTPEELYSNGPHEATLTFDIGNPQLSKERSRNIELTLQKTTGAFRWKANLYRNEIDNFVYGRIDGLQVDEEGAPDPEGEFAQRFWTQSDATIRGAEAEVGYNQQGPGASVRLYADTSRGELNGAGNLPLQPATRFGINLGYRQGAWRSGVDLLRATRQDRLAAFETTETPGYTRLDANLSYTQRYGNTRLTWFALGKNLLDRDIRLSTSVLQSVAPLPGRSLIVGVRTQF
jgi:iron complex outermembrane receptor protein